MRNKYGVDTIGPGGWWKPDEEKHKGLKKRWKKGKPPETEVKKMVVEGRKSEDILNNMGKKDKGRNSRAKLRGRALPYRDD